MSYNYHMRCGEPARPATQPFVTFEALVGDPKLGDLAYTFVSRQHPTILHYVVEFKIAKEFYMTKAFQLVQRVEAVFKRNPFPSVEAFRAELQDMEAETNASLVAGVCPVKEPAPAAAAAAAAAPVVDPAEEKSRVAALEEQNAALTAQVAKLQSFLAKLGIQ
jgi:hypothetical protein